MPKAAFSLAELLIILFIIASIAGYGISKTLSINANQAFATSTKEVIATVAEAYLAYRLSTTVTKDFNGTMLIPYLNFVRRVDNNSVSVDRTYGSSGTQPCDGGTATCLFLHTGGVLYFHPYNEFGGEGPLNAIFFSYDPDSTHTDSSALGSRKAITLLLFFNGKVMPGSSAVPAWTASEWFNGGVHYFSPAEISAWYLPPWYIP